MSPFVFTAATIALSVKKPTTPGGTAPTRSEMPDRRYAVGYALAAGGLVLVAAAGIAAAMI